VNQTTAQGPFECPGIGAAPALTDQLIDLIACEVARSLVALGREELTDNPVAMWGERGPALNVFWWRTASPRLRNARIVGPIASRARLPAKS